ncbi:hypothetical protein [Epilithonimonas xixisoli]|uniref:YobI-like P-loop NTPase domain-containing protein n=1 Tax=Epilithonimonas xixisoli TaxID=1476462 RepID=A0A4V3H2L3_9FLAO|nr:hypothetical protein [Epilithonimonas xixisoli]TDX84606.1 hypothetical protein B0I22_2235 [Epilithonimonas xixisoli]
MKSKFLNKINERYLCLKSNLNSSYLDFLSRLIFFLGEKKIKLLTKNNPNPNDLEDLTPYITKREENNYNQHTYLQSLKWGVLNQNVKNVAVSGSFGTGKSTILNLFKKNNPEFKTLDINLGKFEGKNKQNEVDIETSIVQQILYFEKKKNLKDSRFERITYDKFILVKALLFILWIYSILYLFFEKIYNKLTLVNKVELPSYNYIIKLLFLTGIFLILKKLFRQIFKLKINKVSFSDAEFVPKANDISIINKHVDELVYFFEKTKTQIVFIEDIDRFDDAVDIFIKLRELNIIINNSKDINQKVTFVYAVKDELFSKNNEKTKFFDLIIPIIPIVDYSNSNTQFIKRLKKDFIENKIISEDIIYNISPYISDMRSLINIINEFKTYYKIKSNENNNINGDYLFGLIILKNIYPIDFKSLQNKEGVVYKIFENKNELYKDLEESLYKKIEIIEQENDDILQEQQDNLLELRRVYISGILMKSNDATSYYIDNKTIELESLLEDQKFSEFIKSDVITYYRNHISKFIKFSDVEKDINPQQKYAERRRIVLNKINNIKAINDSEILKLKSQINNLSNSSLNDLLKQSEKNKLDSYFDKIVRDIFTDIESKDDYEREAKIEEIKHNYTLLKVLISNNYIDENYSNYVSLFYPESITEKDNNLKLRIIQDGETHFNESIDKIKNLVTELGSTNFKKESILNFYILDYLLYNYKDNEKVSNKLDEFLNTLTNGKEKSVHFIEKYIDFSELTGTSNEFIRKMAYWEGFWNLIHSRDEFNAEKKKKILDKIFKYTNIDKIKILNKDRKINAFLNNYDDFLINNFDRETKDELIKKLKTIGIKFNKIKYEDSIFEIVLEIIENNLYKININNVNLFLQKFNFKDIDILDYKTSNYSYLLKSDVTYLKENIKNNINEYVEQVLLKLDSNTEEENNVVKDLINNTDVKEENIESLIEKMNFKISDLSEIENNAFWSSLIIWEKIEPNWKNVLLYYSYNSEKIDASFVEFLDNEINYQELGKSCINDFLENESETDEKEYSIIIDKFNVSLVNSEISNESFESLVHSMTKNFDDIAVVNKTDRIKNLIESHLIVFNEKNLTDLVGGDLELFIEKNEANLEEEYETLNLLLIKWVTIFKSHIDGDLKKKIFVYLTNEEIYDSDEDVFLLTIINNFFSSKFYSFSDFFVKSVLESNLDTTIKIKLLIFDKDNITDVLLKDYLELLNPPYSLILQKEKIEIPNSSENTDFMKILQQYGFIKRTYLKDKDSVITVSYNE